MATIFYSSSYQESESIFPSLESVLTLSLALTNRILWKWQCASSWGLAACSLTLGPFSHHVNKPTKACYRTRSHAERGFSHTSEPSQSHYEVTSFCNPASDCTYLSKPNRPAEPCWVQKNHPVGPNTHYQPVEMWATGMVVVWKPLRTEIFCYAAPATYHITFPTTTCMCLLYPPIQLGLSYL